MAAQSRLTLAALALSISAGTLAQGTARSSPSASSTPTLIAPETTPKPASAALPYAMRGVRLGITLDEFREFTPPNDKNDLTPFIKCTDEYLPTPLRTSSLTSEADKADGVTNCQWFSQARVTYYTREMGVEIGEGWGVPLFSFIDDGTGTLRLFRISFKLNSLYGTAIADALSRGFGEPSTQTAPFQTMSGANFTASTLLWDNKLSTITLRSPCYSIERSCLTYRHTKLGLLYNAVREKRAAAAAEKI